MPDLLSSWLSVRTHSQGLYVDGDGDPFQKRVPPLAQNTGGSHSSRPHLQFLNSNRVCGTLYARNLDIAEEHSPVIRLGSSSATLRPQRKSLPRARFETPAYQRPQSEFGSSLVGGPPHVKSVIASASSTFS